MQIRVKRCDSASDQPARGTVPGRSCTERRPSELLLADLAAIRDLAAELGIVSDPADFDTGLSTDDMTAA
jgi:hypothetical protein